MLESWSLGLVEKAGAWARSHVHGRNHTLLGDSRAHFGSIAEVEQPQRDKPKRGERKNHTSPRLLRSPKLSARFGDASLAGREARHTPAESSFPGAFERGWGKAAVSRRPRPETFFIWGSSSEKLSSFPGCTAGKRLVEVWPRAGSGHEALGKVDCVTLQAPGTPSLNSPAHALGVTPRFPCSRKRRLPGHPPRLTILPKRWGPGAVGQFQRRFRNCHLHSRTALCSPPLTLCRIPGFWRIRRRCLRLNSCRLGSSTSCRLLESVSRFVEEATFTIPLVGRMIAQAQEGDPHPNHKNCATRSSSWGYVAGENGGRLIIR